MQNDAKTIETAKKRMSYAFSKIHTMASRIRSAASEAASKNTFGRFKQCKKKMEDIATNFDNIGVSVSKIAETLEKLEYYVRELEGD